MRFSALRIGWRSLGRNPMRTAFALIAIAVGQFALLAMAGLMNGWKDEIVAAITGPMLGDIQINAEEWRKKRSIDLTVPELDSALSEIRALPAALKVFPRVYAPGLAAPREQAHMALIFGVDVALESQHRGLLEGLQDPLGNKRVFIGAVAAEKMNASIGDEIALVGQDAYGSLANDLFTVAAIGSTQITAVNTQGVIMSLEDAQEFLALNDQAHQLIVHADSAEHLDLLATTLRASPTLSGYEILTWREVVPQAVTMIEMIDYMVVFVLLFVFVAAIAGIANTMLMSTYERQHEIGMLLALGASPRRIRAMVMAEAAVLGVAGAVVGSLLGGAFVFVAARTGLDFSVMGGETASSFDISGMTLPMLVYPWLKVSDVAIGVVAVVAMSVISAIWPAWMASRLEPMEALRD